MSTMIGKQWADDLLKTRFGVDAPVGTKPDTVYFALHTVNTGAMSDYYANNPEPPNEAEWLASEPVADGYARVAYAQSDIVVQDGGLNFGVNLIFPAMGTDVQVRAVAAWSDATATDESLLLYAIDLGDWVTVPAGDQFTITYDNLGFFIMQGNIAGQQMVVRDGDY